MRSQENINYILQVMDFSNAHGLVRVGEGEGCAVWLFEVCRGLR